jgi:hypothetical protein
MSPEYTALIDRWNGFLDKIKARYLEVLEQSKEPLNDVIGGLEYDSIIIHNVLNGLKYQSQGQLSKKMEDTWEKVEHEFEKLDIDFDVILKEQKKHHDLTEWMRDDFERFSIRTFADAARQIEKNIHAAVDPNQIQLKVEVFAFQAINVKCAGCGTINTYEPDGRVRQLEGVYSSLADEFAMEEKILKDKSNQYGAPYFKKYYGFIIEKLPQRKEYYERLLNDKLNNPDFVGK